MEKKDLRIIYMGTPDFAVESLRALVEGGYQVVAVVTMPDKPMGRHGSVLQASAVKQYALSVGLPVLQPVKLKDEAFLEELRSYQADLQIVVAFRMLPEVVWNMPRFGTFNLHASLLPQYRGAAPINWAIINGDTETGVTSFFLTHEIDTGRIIRQKRYPIADTDTAEVIHDALMRLGAGLVTETVDLILSGEVESVAQETLYQDASTLRPAPKIFKETCRIDFGVEGERIIRLIRGLAPYPGAWTRLEERSAVDATLLRTTDVKIYAARFEATAGTADRIGEVTAAGGVLRIACRDGYILPELLQPAGKPRMAVRDYLNGWKPRGECRCV